MQDPFVSGEGVAGSPAGPSSGTLNTPVQLPATAPQLSAAREAADFVARIFADAGTQESGEDPVVPSPIERLANAAETSSDMPMPVEPHGAGMQQLQGQNILILGLGASGLAMARWCVRCGAHVTVADTRADPPNKRVLQEELAQVHFVSGPFNDTLVQGQGLHAVYRSPGLSPETIAPVLEAASTDGISVGGELSLYCMALNVLRDSHGYAPAVLAITGTNGKTTVTSLTGLLVERAGRTVAVAGNIGPSLMDTLAAHIDAGTLPQVWVLELSSFQLDGSTAFEPTAATVLNITQDHLDWHGDIQAYSAAKGRIFGQHGLMVLNREDLLVMDMLSHASTAAGTVGAKPLPGRGKAAKIAQREYTTFGGDMPRRAGDFGIEMVNGMAWLVRAMESDETRKRSRGEEDRETLHIQRLIPADALRIRGRHNAVNALAALALAAAAGCALAPMLYGLREYRGEPHRVEPVAIVNEVEYFDDSKGTNVGATVAALTSLGVDRRVVLILGGEGKGQDFSSLAAPVSRYARAVVLIGRDASLIRTALQETGVAMFSVQTLPRAVEMAAQRAHAGDAVLMSPACASFDMFKDYAHRAEVFCESVRALSEHAGQLQEGMQ